MINKLFPKRIKKLLRVFTLYGSNVECPICNGSFITFLPFGIPPMALRPNALCPKCGSLERTRIYWMYLSSIPGFFTASQKILHIAPEKVLFKKLSSLKNIEYCPGDKFEPGYKYPKGTKNLDITKLKFPDSNFDFILCSHVLEHIKEDLLAIQELYRVLKPNGFGIVQVPIDYSRKNTYEDFSIINPQSREVAFGQSDHVRIYGKDYKERLEKVGFILEQNTFSLDISESDRFKFGFGKGEILYVVRKP